MSFRFEVQRDDLANTRTIDLPTPEQVTLAEGEALVRVDRFALTANNITYGVVGEMIGYWQFFPAEDPWGVIPVWGVGTVLRANGTGLEEGDRYYGYFPMASYLVVRPGVVSARGFGDEAAHRAGLPAVYNQYARMTPDNGFAEGLDDQQMVYRPLFTTAFLIDDYLRDNAFFGARDVILGSASSKTALGTAFLLHRGTECRVIGLTSKANRDFVESTGVYHQVLAYEDLAQLDATRPAAYVDMSGSGSVLSALHHHFGDRLVSSTGVGVTHFDDWGTTDTASLPGATPAMFFAPDRVAQRTAEWGQGGFQRRLDAAWQAFLPAVADWIEFDHREGAEGVAACYAEMRAGASPRRAHVVLL